LFSIVREERQLTYDASFQWHGKDAIQGGFYQVSVTSTPALVQRAVQACKVALKSLKREVYSDSISSAKKTIVQKYEQEKTTNQHWIEQLSGCQNEAIPLNSAEALLDFEELLHTVTAEDVQLVSDLMDFDDEEKMTVCVGVAAPSENDQEIGQGEGQEEEELIEEEKGAKQEEEEEQQEGTPSISIPSSYHRHTILS
jgi:predicted Zn-dependent peptidase